MSNPSARSNFEKYSNRLSVRSLFWPPDENEKQFEGAPFELNYASWLIRLRWLVIIIISGLALLNAHFLHYVEEGPMVGVWATIIVLIALNILFSVLRPNSFWGTQKGLLTQVSLDMLCLTVLLHFSGGIENPLSFAYVFHVILGSIMFKRPTALLVVLCSTLLVAILAFGEFAEIFHHYTIGIFPHFEGESGEQHASHDLVYVSVRVGLHFLFMVLSSGFVTALMTRLNNATTEIRNERLKLHHVIETTGIGLAIIHKDGVVEALNPGDQIWLALGGLSKGATWRLWLSDILAEEENGKENRLSGYEKDMHTTSGETRHFQVNISSGLASESGEDLRGTVLITDISERKRLEAEMMHSDRITMLGKVSAGIAHEVGNPLASISTRIALLEDSDTLDELKSGLNPLKDQILRINRIVRGVSQIARPQQGKWKSFDLRKTIDDTMEVVRLHKSARRNLLELKIQDHPLLVNGVEDQIEQVFLNLCLNGLEAMPEGGELSISCSSRKNCHIVKIADSGIGMTDEEQARVFDLFFTTKKNGLGIGMHIAFQIINAHSGTISVSSTPGYGTTFTIALPKSDFQSGQLK